MDKIIEELKLALTVDTSKLDSDSKKFVNKMNNAIKEVTAAAAKLDKAFEFMTPADIKKFEDGIKSLAEKIKAESKSFEKNNFSLVSVTDVEKASKNINKVMNTYTKSYGAALSVKTKLYEKNAKAEIDSHIRNEKVKAAITISNVKAANKEKEILLRQQGNKELLDYKEQLKAANRERRKIEAESNKKNFGQKVIGAGETLSKYAFGSVLASPAFAISQFAISTMSDIVKGSIQYSREMAKIQAITGASSKEMGEFNKSIREVGLSFGYTAQQGADTILVLSRLGVSSRDLASVLQSTAAFATATGSSLEKSGELLVNTMNAFNISYDKSTDTVDQMTKTLNASALDVEKYATILGYVGAAANENNITFEETNAMLTLLSKNGLKASTVGTSLREIIGTLSSNGRDLSTVLEELSKDNLSYADAVELVGKRAANALTILVEHNKEIKTTSQYLRLSILDTNEQAKLMAQISSVEQLAREWTGAMTAMKSFFGFLSMNDTNDVVEKLLAKARYANRGFSQQKELGGLGKYDEKDVANAYKIPLSQWMSGLTDKDRKAFGFDATNQLTLEKNLKNALKSQLMKEESFLGRGGNEKMAEIVVNNIVSGIMTDNLSYIKEEIGLKAKKKLADLQREDKASKSSSEILREQIREISKDYGVMPFFSEDDLAELSKTDVSSINRRDKARAKYNEALAVDKWYKSLGDKATEADRLKWKAALERSKKLDEEWGFKEKESRGGKKKLSIGDLSNLLEPLKVSPDMKAALDEAETISLEYRRRIADTTDKSEIDRITKDYFEAIKSVRNSIESDDFMKELSSKSDELEYIGKLLDDVTVQFKKDLDEKYKGKEKGIHYETELKSFQSQAETLRRNLRLFNTKEVGILTDTRESLDKLIGTTVKVDEFLDRAINFEDTQEALNAISKVTDVMKDYQEARAAGKTYKTKGAAKREIVSGLSEFRKSNLAAYESRKESLSVRNKELQSDLDLVNSDKPLAPDEADMLYVKYGTKDKNAIRKTIESRKQATQAGLLSAETIYTMGEQKAEGFERQIREQDKEDLEIKKAFGADLTRDAMSSLVDFYAEMQDEMLQAQRERIEAEIQNERNKVDSINNLNSASVERGLMTQEEYATQKAQMEQDLYDKENALMKAQFEEEKKAELKMAGIKLTQRIAEIALNVLVSNSKQGIIGLIGAPAVIGAFSAMAAAQSAMEMAAISKKEYIPKRYAEGGIVEGNSHANGGIPFTVNGKGGYEMEGGEFIVKKSEVPRNIGTLRAINNGTFQSSSYYSNSDDISLKLDALIEASSKPVRAFVTSGDLDKNNRARIIIGNKTQV